MPTKFFGNVRQKIFDGKLWYRIMHKHFPYAKFSETLKGSPRNFSALWDQKISTENRDTPPPPFIKTFSMPETNEALKDSNPYGNIRHCETKNFRQKIFKLPPPLLSINFFATGNFLKHSTEGLTYQIFRHCERKKFRQKIENRDITLWSIKFFDTRN